MIRTQAAALAVLLAFGLPPTTGWAAAPLSDQKPAAWATPSSDSRGDTSPYKTAQEHYEALKKAAGGGHRLTKAEVPDWSGVWTVDGPFANFDPSLVHLAPKYGPLTPDNQKYYDQIRQNLAQQIEWDPLAFCLPAGAVRWSNMPRLKDYAVTPNVTYLMNEIQSETRRIYTDGRDHRPEDEAYPLWNGDSIGFWEGSGDRAKLTVWTKYLRAGIYHRNGPRYSDQIELIEVYQKIDDSHIALELTAYDPVDLTRPWKIRQRAVKGVRADERVDTWACDENNNIYIENGQTKFHTLGDPEYKDPEVFTDPTKMLEIMTPKK